MSALPLHAATFQWTGDGANNLFNTSDNWDAGVPDNDGTADLTFGDTARLNPSVNTSYAVQGITFLSSAGPYSLTGSALSIGSGGITNDDGDLQSFSNALSLTSSQSWNASAGAFNFTGAVNLGSYHLTVVGPHAANFGSSIAGTGSISFSNDVSSTLTGSNTYTGSTTISASNSGATVYFDNASAFGGGGAIDLRQNGELILRNQGGSSVTLANEFTWNGGRYAASSSPVIDVAGASDTLIITNGIDMTSRGGFVKEGQGTLQYTPSALLADSRWSLGIREGLVEMNQLPARTGSGSNSGQATGDLQFLDDSTLKITYNAAVASGLSALGTNNYLYGYGFANVRVDDDVTATIEAESGAVFKTTGRTDTNNEFLGDNATLILDGADLTSAFIFGVGNSGGSIDNNLVNRTVELRGGTLSFFSASGKTFWPQSLDCTMKLNGGRFDGSGTFVDSYVALPGNLVIGDDPSASAPQVVAWQVGGTGGSNSSFGNTYWNGTLEKVGSSGDTLLFNRTVSGTGTAGTVTIENNALLDIQGGVVDIRGAQDPLTDSINQRQHVDVSIASGAQLNVNRDVGIGQLTGSGTITSTTAGTFKLLLESNDDSTFAGSINSGTGTIHLVKDGSANQTLTAANSLSGSVTINNGALTLANSGTLLSVAAFEINKGDLILDNTTTNLTNRVNDAAPISLSSGSGSGTLRLLGNSSATTTETVGAVTTATGASAIYIEPGSGQSASLTLSSLSQTSGGQMLFVAATGTLGGGAATDPSVFITGQAAGLIGGWATVGNSFATYNLTHGVQALATYSNDINTTTPHSNISLSSSDAASPNRTLGATFIPTEQTNVDNLRLDATTVTLNSGKTLNLQQGGLIGFNGTSSLTGDGTLTAGGTAAGDLSVFVEGGSTLTIDNAIVDNSSAAINLAVAGGGTVVLTNNANNYSGDTFLNGGTLQISSQNQLGSSGNDLYFSGGTLSTTGGVTLNSGRTMTVVDGSSGTINNASTVRLQEADSLIGGETTTLYKIGDGTLRLDEANTTFSGTLNINQGRVELRHVDSLGGAGDKALVVLDGGRLVGRFGTGSNDCW